MVSRIGGRSPQNFIDRVVDDVGNKLLHLDGGRPTRLGGPLETQHWLQKNYGQWFKPAPKKDGKFVTEPRPWPLATLGPTTKSTNVFLHNERTVKAPPAKVFEALRDGGNWSKVCDNLTDAKIEGGGTKFEKGSKFNWTTFGSNLNGEVLELEDKPANPNDPLVLGFHGLDSHTGGKDVEVYHRYLLYPIRDPANGQVTGTRLVTEEAQRGRLTKPLPVVGATHEKMMTAGHQYVLDCLADAATKQGGWR
jgi:hypothetical protein